MYNREPCTHEINIDFSAWASSIRQKGFYWLYRAIKSLMGVTLIHGKKFPDRPITQAYPIADRIFLWPTLLSRIWPWCPRTQHIFELYIADKRQRGFNDIPAWSPEFKIIDYPEVLHQKTRIITHRCAKCKTPYKLPIEKVYPEFKRSWLLCKNCRNNNNIKLYKKNLALLLESHVELQTRITERALELQEMRTRQ